MLVKAGQSLREQANREFIEVVKGPRSHLAEYSDTP